MTPERQRQYLIELISMGLGVQFNEGQEDADKHAAQLLDQYTTAGICRLCGSSISERTPVISECG